jgi:hypothetical protein
MAEVIIGRAGWDYLRITVPTPGPHFFNGDVEIQCHAWRGKFEAGFRRGELRGFAQQLRKLYEQLSGTARLQQHEPYLDITCTGDGRGHIVFHAIAQEAPNTGVQLHFKIGLDQTQLPAIIDALDAIDPPPVENAQS